MKNELVSIIVPIYKVEQYLKECIDSIRNQTYKNLEIILVDDGSPDNCGEICDEYAKKDARIKIIHKENGGLSSARNAGLDIATGEYISFIDSDDYVSEKFIEVLYNLCKENNSEIAVCDFIRFDDEVTDIDVVSEIKNYTAVEMQERIYSDERVKSVVVWNKLYKKRIYEKLRFPNGKINEDEFTTYKAFNSTEKNIVVTNEPLYYYRYNENSIMGRKFNVNRLDVLLALEERVKYYKDRKIPSLYEETVKLYQNKLREYYELTESNIKNNKKLLKNILKLARNNYKKYATLSGIHIKEKIKNWVFIIFPNMYLNLRKIKICCNDLSEKTKRKKCINKYKRYKDYCKRNNKKEFIIFNTPLHGNLGDHAIIYAENKFLKKFKIKSFEISSYKENYYFNYLKENISKDAVIAITGGGFIGSQWLLEENLVNKVLNTFYKHKVIIFPQTFYFKNDFVGKRELQKSIKTFSKCGNLCVFAREKVTFNFIKENYKNVKVILVPDIVLSLPKYTFKCKRNGILICLRNDPESQFSLKQREEISKLAKGCNSNIKYTDTVVNYDVIPQKRNKEIKKKLREYASASLIITDRLHGMIFATLAQTPCIVLGNYNQKVKGVYEWIEKNDKNIIFVDNLNRISDIANNLIAKIDVNEDRKLNGYNFEKLYSELEEII